MPKKLLVNMIKDLFYFLLNLTEKKEFKLNVKREKWNWCRNNDNYREDWYRKNLQTFQLITEELHLSPMKDLSKFMTKIEFSEEIDFRSALYADFPAWHIIVDGKDY